MSAISFVKWRHFLANLPHRISQLESSSSFSFFVTRFSWRVADAVALE